MTLFAALLHALPLILGGLLALFAFVGFWRGLGLKPHKPGHRPPPLSRYYWWAND